MEAEYCHNRTASSIVAGQPGCRKTIQAHALHPQQQFRHTTGKNATDSA